MISAELNRRIIQLAPKHTASDNAPYSYETLRSASTSSLVVWSGASDKTIYGDASVNWAFRAWHDSLHLKLNAEFNESGERRVAFEQARLIGGGTFGTILVGEIVGQAEYLNKYGQFPVDQVEFMRNYLKGMI